jgi:hypothetical protein
VLASDLSPAAEQTLDGSADGANTDSRRAGADHQRPPADRLAETNPERPGDFRSVGVRATATSSWLLYRLQRRHTTAYGPADAGQYEAGRGIPPKTRLKRLERASVVFVEPGPGERAFNQQGERPA